MPLADGSIRVLQEDENKLRPAYLVRFPEDVWASLERTAETGDAISIDCSNGMHINIPGMNPIALTVQPSGTSSEIYLSQSKTITPQAIASARLTLPLSSANTSRAVDKMKAQNEAHDKERKDRADRLNGIKKAAPPPPPLEHTSLNMGRTMSSPVIAGTTASGSSTPTVPLKTRVVQLLALGPLSIEEIVSRVGMTEGEVVRVVKGVGRETPEGYGLQPAKYSGLKIATWPYTYAEKQRVIQLAKLAFDELGYPEDADERADLDRKEAEVMSGGTGTSADTAPPPPMQSTPATIPPPIASPALPASPVLGAVQVKKEKGSKKTGLGLIGKQRAKFQAEKRAASLPNVKKEDGTASPRAEPSPLSKEVPVVKESKPIKRKREDDPPAPKRRASPVKSVAAPVKASSPATTNSSEESRGRSKTKDLKGQIKKNGTEKGKKTPRARDYSSSERSSSESEEEKALSTIAKLPKIPRKSQPPPLELANGHKEEPPDPEALRERYEELFPAYELLSRKLALLHREAEGEEEGEVVEMTPAELEKMVGRWQKWHRELEGIRRYFTA